MAKNANGDTMKATYNSIGQMIAEKWFDCDDVLVAHYKYTYDAQGNIVRSIDITAQKEYDYMYENGLLTRSAEYDITISDELVTEKTHAASTRYYYDNEGNLTKKRVIHSDGTESVIYHETNDDNTIVKFTAGGKTVTSHSKTDSFGRKVFDELQLGTGFVSRQFAYFAGDIPDEHKDNGKVKSAATTNLVSQIILSDGRTISYEYDAEERITKVTDSIDGTYDYTYDALGQLLTETKDGVTTKFEYDNYGNITAKGAVDETGEIAEATKITYTYGNTAWKDLLTSYNGQAITYDAQGNPTSYLGHTLTWEKGRQLKSFDTNTYTYNANGIRTSKTVGGIRHDYTLDGAKILREAWTASGVNRYIIPLYDNEDAVCGINYCGTPFYFLKNLQGDVIAITNADGETVARYTYDAWGVCTVASDTSGRNISIVNPYRYRGYYYDSEIGMYYLQSRYYNPVVGRFVNGDGQINAYGIIELNLYSYTMNRLINYSDYNGRDAAILFQSNGAYGMGHAAMIVEVPAGLWYYFSIGKGNKGIKTVDFIYLGYRLKINGINSVNRYINSASKRFGKHLATAGVYTSMHYFNGNFSASYSWFKSIYNKPNKYNLFFDNCLQNVAYALSLGRCTGTYAWEYQQALDLLKIMTIPNSADYALGYFERSITTYYRLPWYRRIFIKDPYYYFGNGLYFGNLY